MVGNCFNCGGLFCFMIGYDVIWYRVRGKFYLVIWLGILFCGNVFLILLVKEFLLFCIIYKLNS